ncbi:MAG: DUF2691 family protein [Bacillota bacterium]|jgi:hypothetical protein
MEALSFETPNAYGNYLYDLCKDIPLEKYVWEFGFNEMFPGSGSDVEKITTKGFISGEEFIKTINFPAEGNFLIFMSIRACFKGRECNDITTYDDFIKSDCQIVINVDDSLYVNVYAKDPGILDIFRANAEKLRFTDIEYFTPESDRLVFDREIEDENIDVNVREKDTGATPLIVLSLDADCEPIVEYLLAQGADKGLKDYAGKTKYDYLVEGLEDGFVKYENPERLLEMLKP